MKDFGNGPTLRDACIWLCDQKERHRRILDVAERNSVIEGLPPFSEELRERLLRTLAAMTTPAPPQRLICQNLHRTVVLPEKCCLSR